MAEIIYLLCGAASLLCSLLLFRGYRMSGSSLLFWSSIGFIGLAANNVILCVDLIAYPEIDLSFYRSIPALLGLMVMTFGLIRETTSL